MDSASNMDGKRDRSEEVPGSDAIKRVCKAKGDEDEGIEHSNENMSNGTSAADPDYIYVRHADGGVVKFKKAAGAESFPDEEQTERLKWKRMWTIRLAVVIVESKTNGDFSYHRKFSLFHTAANYAHLNHYAAIECKKGLFCGEEDEDENGNIILRKLTDAEIKMHKDMDGEQDYEPCNCAACMPD